MLLLYGAPPTETVAGQVRGRAERARHPQAGREHGKADHDHAPARNRHSTPHLPPAFTLEPWTTLPSFPRTVDSDRLPGRPTVRRAVWCPADWDHSVAPDPGARDPSRVRTLPDGELTLLFTDIDGSTRLVQKYGDGYPDVLAEHRRCPQTGVRAPRRRGGRHPGRCLFRRVPTSRRRGAAGRGGATTGLPAARCACAWGCAPGTPLRTAEGYAGIHVHRAARIAAAGHGGPRAALEVVGRRGRRAVRAARSGRAPAQGSSGARVDLPGSGARAGVRLSAAAQPQQHQPAHTRAAVGGPRARAGRVGERDPVGSKQGGHADRRRRHGEDEASRAGRIGAGRALPQRRAVRGTRAAHRRQACDSGDRADSGCEESPGEPLLETLAAHLEMRRMLLILDHLEYVIDAAADVAGLSAGPAGLRPSRPAASRCASIQRRSSHSRRSRRPTRSSSLPTGPGWSIPISRRTLRPPRSAGCWTGCPSPSSWPPPGSGCCRRRPCWSDSNGVYRCSARAPATSPTGNGRSRPQSTGAMACCPRSSRSCFETWRCLQAVARWKRRRPCAPPTPMCWRRWCRSTWCFDGGTWRACAVPDAGDRARVRE